MALIGDKAYGDLSYLDSNVTPSKDKFKSTELQKLAFKNANSIFQTNK